ncbi:MAG TPA: metal-dependent hydrolase [Verrucomicrobiales bacterium]|nr:metal-dependent hydrolase [Verrucomicrobiales bacterium]
MRLLIDAGFSGRQIRQRLAAIGRSPETLTGILLTHEHSDHTQGLGMIAAKLNIPLYCNRLTREAVESQFKVPFNCRIFATGAAFDVGDVHVETFSVPHDAYDPVGFLLRTAAGNVGFLTDLGHATKAVVERVRPANVLVLETNYDLKLLQADTKRPWSIKQRILSRHGHLSNENAADVLEQVASDALQHVYCGHLSRDCNTPELAAKVVGSRLEKLGAKGIGVETTSQEAASPTFELAARLRAVVEKPAVKSSPAATDWALREAPSLPGF